MKRKTVLIIGILATVMVFGAALALAQNSSEKKKFGENHENMMDDEKGHSGMMDNEKPEGEDTDTEGDNHCGDMDSDMGSMMSSSDTDMKEMM
jgi:hypothetical protein